VELRCSRTTTHKIFAHLAGRKSRRFKAMIRLLRGQKFHIPDRELIFLEIMSSDKDGYNYKVINESNKIEVIKFSIKVIEEVK